MAVIRGQVVDAAGEPVALAAIYVLSAPKPHPDVAQLSSSDGRFELSATAPGSYTIGARSDTAGEGRTSVIVRAGDENVPARIALTRSD